jgi:hypothetical protein
VIVDVSVGEACRDGVQLSVVVGPQNWLSAMLRKRRAGWYQLRECSQIVGQVYGRNSATAAIALICMHHELMTTG